MNSSILTNSKLNTLKELSNLSILKFTTNLRPSNLNFNLYKGSINTSIHHAHTLSPILRSLETLPPPSSLNFHQKTIENNIPPKQPKQYSTSVEEKLEKCMDGNEAAATIAYSINDVAFVYPITPSSVMAECVDNWSAEQKINIWGNVVKSLEMESEAGVAGALHGALSAGALSTSFTSSQGLLLMIPNMYKIAGELLPCVLHVASRAISTHALSIFGDHSDVMAARSTGWNMLCSDSVQASLDMALVAQMATFQCSLPFIHFFEGFRTSHEISKIKLISNQVIKTLVDQTAIEHFRNRALNPTHPSAKGSSQGPEIYFQNAEAANKYYEQVPDIVEDCMNKLNFAVGRRYNLFDYYGPEDATDVIVVMGSGAYVCKAASEILNQNYGRKTGVLNVRLFRPWSKKHFLEALPSTVERIAVLDRCKENGSIGEPLFTDVCTTLFSEPMEKKIRIIGGRYGIASKDFTPGMAIAVYENLASPAPKFKFTVGIDDDVTNLSLPYENLDLLGNNMIQCLFWGFGSDGTVGANKDAIKIIGDNTDLYGQAYFSYSAHKSRGITTSHLRFGPEPINAPYLVTSADYIACHYPGYISKFDMLSKLKPNGIFVLNTDWPIDELDKHLPYWVKRQLAEKMPKFYVIDANKIANELGLGDRINMIMQSVFFYLARVIPYKEATTLIKQAIERTYSSKGMDVIQNNKKCVDLAISNLKKVQIPNDWKYAKRDDYFTGIKSLSEYVNNVVAPSHHLRANEIPVSKLPADGSIEPGTSKYEKLLSAKVISVYDPTKCIQCNKCTLICPHAAIRPVLVTDEKLKEAPQGFITRLLKTKKRKLNYRIQVSPYDCTGCTLCVNICPSNSLSMQPTRKMLKKENDNYNFSLTVPTVDNLFKKESIKGSQFQQPLLEFSGACEGCQETVYVKLLTQLYGDHLILANATGCSSIWGLSCPTNPFTVNRQGFGPAWANSLFEDNAEFGYGIHHASVQRRENLKHLMESLIQPDTQIKISKELKDLIPKWIKTFDDYDANKIISEKLEKVLAKEKSNDPRLEEIYKRRDLFRKITTWIVGGDGWAYDIGYSGVDHVLASGDRVRILVLDTECYSNTGGQASKSTPLGAVQFFSKNGKSVNKKELGLMAMQYKNVYVASVSIAANPNQALKALVEAENFPGPSIVIAHSPCQLHGIRGGMKNVLDEAKLAVDSGYWPLYRYNPMNKEQPFIYESLNIKDNVAELLKNENRFSQLIRKNPEYGQEMTKKAQQYYLRRHQYLLALANEETLKDTSAFTSIQLKPTDHTELSKLDAKILSNIKELVILYGTEYGTSEAIAKNLVKNAKEHGCPKVTMMEANKFNVNDDLDKVEYLIFICSTTGNGQFPQNAQSFWDKLSKLKTALPNLKYSILGLGDSSYAQYCYTAKVVDAKLAELGAQKIYQSTLTDDKAKVPIESIVEKWEINLFKNLGSKKFETPQIPEKPVGRALSPLEIIYGTEGGYTEVIVSKILNDIVKSGEYNVHANEANNVDMEKLMGMNDVIFVTSTTEDGQLPPNVEEFWENLTKVDERYPALENLKYSILSIEDSSFARSGEAAHLLDEKIKTLGGHKVVKFTTIDINSDVSRQDSVYDEWIKQVYKALNISEEQKAKEAEDAKNREANKEATTPKHPDIEKLDIIYGTETGQSEIVAEMIAEDAEKAGISEVEIHVADKVKVEDLSNMKHAIFITSTSGDGEFPPNALEFWDRLSKATPETLSLDQMKFTVYGLGDSSYDKFCEAARLVNEKLEALGAHRFYPYTTLDDQNEKDPEIEVRMWISDVMNKLSQSSKDSSAGSTNSSAPALPPVNGKGVYVIYGTELGSSERIANQLSEEAIMAGLPRFVLMSADDVTPADLAKMTNAIFITSTSGEGEFPPNALQFWDRLSKTDATKTSLAQLKFAVFGLGDSTYEKFCEAARLINEKVEALGGQSFYPYTTIDDNDITRNQDEEVKDWIDHILKKLKTLHPEWNDNTYGARDEDIPVLPADAPEKLSIIYGTELGASENIARMVETEAKRLGLSKVEVLEADQVKLEDLTQMKHAIFITSTSGEGEFPPNALQFWDRLSKTDASKTSLAQLKFAVFGLGDSTYEKFCEAARLINEKLEALGGQRFYPYTTIDDNNITRNQDQDVQNWIDHIMKELHLSNGTSPPRSSASPSGASSSPTTTATVKAPKELNILFGTQCGLSEDLSNLIGEEAEKRGFKVTVNGANKILMDQFKTMNNVLVVTSTVDGTFPPSIFKFYNRIKAEGKDRLDLSSMRFTVLGLGSTSQEKFCEAARLINQRLEELGAQHYLPYTTFDDQDKEDVEVKAEKYMDQLFQTLSHGHEPSSSDASPASREPVKKVTTASKSAEVKPARKRAKAITREKVINIIYGTELGTTEAVAKKMAKEAKENGFVRVNLYEADNVDLYGLSKMKTVVFLMPTAGDGEFPPNAQKFWERLEPETKEQYDLSQTKFAVLGLGDSSYYQFCKAGKFIDKKLKSLGATRIQKFTTIDENNIEQNPDEVIADWQQEIFDKLGAEEFDEHGQRRDAYPSHSNGIQHNRAKICELNIIHGTESGLAEDLAEVIGEAALTHGFSEVTVCGANKIHVEDLEKMKYVVVVTTTVDDALPPSISYFWDRIVEAKQQKINLSHLQFTVLGIDNRKGKKFCEAARLINAKMAELGAVRFFNYTTMDSQNETVIEKELPKYIDALYASLKQLRDPSTDLPYRSTPEPVSEPEPEPESKPESVPESESKPKEAAPTAEPKAIEPVALLDVIFGTETGSSEAIADMISEDAQKAGIPEVRVHAADEVSLEDLQQMKYVTLVTSTSGDGEFPPNAMEFWNRLSKADTGKTSLTNLKFTVLGLGDSTYAKFCEAARLVNEKLEALGGQRFYPYTTLDEQSDKDPEEVVNQWIQQMLQHLHAADGNSGDAPKATAPAPPTAKKASPSPSPAQATAEPIDVLDVIFGTETGTSEAVADMISEDAQKAGIPEVHIHPADDVSLEDLQKMKYIAFVTSTSGEGEFPPNALEFWNRLSKAEAGKTSLAKTKFAVFGLGDSSYSKFCEAARLVNEKFESLGAQRFYPFTTFDDQSDQDQEEYVEQWIQKMLEGLKGSPTSAPASEPSEAASVEPEEPASSATTPNSAIDTLTIIYGTETGTTEAVVSQISEVVQKAGVAEIKILPANEVKLEDLPTMKHMVFITSTFRSRFPSNAQEFWKRLSSASKDKIVLDGVKFAVLGFGDSSYEKFCEAARLVNEKLEALGAERIHAYQTIDDQYDENPETTVNQWIQEVLQAFDPSSIPPADVKTSTSTPSSPSSTLSEPIEVLDVIFGTETGTAEAVADMISEDAQKAGIPEVHIHPADDVSLEDLQKMKYIAFVTSTSGEGEFPPNALEFWNRLSKAEAGKTSLAKTKFAVFGLGDSAYAKFCEAARLVNEKFESLGAQRFYPYTTFDDQSDQDQEDYVEQWIQKMLEGLKASSTSTSASTSTSTPVASANPTSESSGESEERQIQKCDLQTEIHIIYGTKTNHSRDIANMICADAKKAGLPYVYVHEANTVKVEDLGRMKNIVMIAPTYTGKFPEDTLEFWETLSQKTLDTLDLSETRYSVLGLGYHTSPRFCLATKALNQKFQELGSTEFYPYTETDVEHSEDPERWINQWSEKLLNALIDLENREVAEDIGRRRLINDRPDQLNIIFGTESEHAQDVAGMLSDEVKEAGLTNINIFSADRIHPSDLAKMKTLILVTSTYKGTLPPNAHQFWDRITTTEVRLPQMNYAVFGLGDSTHEKYCEAARLLDAQFEKLGAHRIHPLATLDAHADYDQIEVINRWIHEILDLILPGMQGTSSPSTQTTTPPTNTKDQDPSTELHVIFGTKSTHAEDVANIVELDAQEAGYTSVTVHEADTVKVDDLPNFKNVVFITSTINGDFPPDTQAFWQAFSQKTPDTLSLQDLHYTVLGVGDRGRSKDFCAAAKKLNQQFKKLGAQEFYPYTEVDIEHHQDPGQLISQWTHQFLSRLPSTSSSKK